MTLDELEQLRPGDEVWIKTRAICVAEPNGNYEGIAVRRIGEATSPVHRSHIVEVIEDTYPADILSVTPAPREIKVRDLVTWEGTIFTWRVVAIDGSVAWVKHSPGGARSDQPLAALRHAVRRSYEQQDWFLANPAEGHAP